jgi:FAD/FMN-containing dehydrogenase
MPTLDIAAPALGEDLLLSRLAEAIGAANVLTDDAERQFFSQDIFSAGVMPICVVQPGSVEDVQACVAICAKLDVAIIPRGGGMSYTSGYLTDRPRSVTFDLRRLDKIIALSPDDMTATVEAGCTWEALNDALAPHGLRPTFWGPVSGGRATVGGVMSQNSTFWGAVRSGAAAQNVLGFDVVLADGSILSTGARGGRDPEQAFFRHYGPELTGLFTGDCGALGIKVRATLPLEVVPACKTAISIGFDDPYPLLAALSEMSRRRLISEVAFFDRVQQQARVANVKLPLKRLIETFLAVVKSDGLGSALSMAVAGQGYLDEVACSLHLITEGPTPRELARFRREIHAIAARHKGRPIEASIGRVLAARPFPPPDMSLTSSRFLPVHAIVPHSKAQAVYREALDLFAANAQACEALGITQGMFGGAAGNGALLIEATWHWKGAFLESHTRLFEKPFAAFAAGLSPAPEAQVLVDRLADEMIAMFCDQGAAHYQIGRRYPFRRSRGAANGAWLEQIKHMADPKGIMNPGALGFETQDLA